MIWGYHYFRKHPYMNLVKYVPNEACVFKAPKVWCFGPQITNPPKPPLYMYPDHPLRYHEISFICFEMVFPRQMPYILIIPIHIRFSIQPTTKPLWLTTGHPWGITYHRSIPHLVPKQRSKELDLGDFPTKSMGNPWAAWDSGFWTVFCVGFL